MNTAGVQLISDAVSVCGVYGCGTSGGDSILINTPFGVNLQAGSDAPGTWSGPVENAPEPSSLLLFGAGLLGFVLGGLWRANSPAPT